MELTIVISEKYKITYPNTKRLAPDLLASVVTNSAYLTILKIHADMQEWLRLHPYARTGSMFNIYQSSQNNLAYD